MSNKLVNSIAKLLFILNFGKNIAFGFISLVLQSITISGVFHFKWYAIPIIFLLGFFVLFGISYLLEITGIRREFKNAEFKDTELLK